MARVAISAGTFSKRPGQTDEEFAEEMRARGYKQVTRWVLDLENPNVLDEYRRQLEKLAEHQRKEGVPDFFPPDEDIPGWS